MDLDKNMRSLDSNLKLELEEERDKRVQVIFRIDSFGRLKSRINSSLCNIRNPNYNKADLKGHS